MITLHQFAPSWGLNPSPFCLKVEIWLRLAGLPYRTVATLPMGAPKRKLPFVVLEDGRRIGDSGFIIAALTQAHGFPRDDGLTEAQHARGHLLRRTIEESLYFLLAHARWLDPDAWNAVGPAFFGRMPQPVRTLLPPLLRRRVRRALYLQGIGRHSPAEVLEIGTADLAAIATSLRETGFAVTDRPTSYDATVYAMLTNILRPPLDIPLKRAALRHDVLSDYLVRMDQVLV